MKHKLFLKAISALLVVPLAMSIMPMAVFATETEIATLQDDELITTYQSFESTLAPGITQSINSGYAADGKLINYYIAIADINRDDVGVQASYKDAQCTTLGMSKMTEQAAAMNKKHTNADDAENYIPHYAVVAGVNGDGYNTGTAMPSGAHVMNGVSGFGITKAGNSSWFAIFEDGTALCGANNADWDEAVTAHGPVQEAIGGFQLVRKNGVDVAYTDSSYLNDGRYPRSFVGVTADNKVVFMEADGNGSGGSVGTNWKESVEIMDEVGCTYILCLDGGGSATYISRPAGSSDIQVTSNPSDGSERAVSNGLVMYTSTPPSDVFEKAEITAENYYVTPGSEVKVSAVGISPAGTAADIPESAVWTATNGTVENGVFISDGTIGAAEVSLMVEGAVVGTTTINVVLPDTIAFTRDIITVPFGATVALEVTAKYGLYDVAVKNSDITFTLSNNTAGSISGTTFTAANEGEGTTITASVNGTDPAVTDTLEVQFGKGSEVLFDFETSNIGADLTNWRTSHHGGYDVSDLSIVTKETGMVHSGDQALAFHYPMDQALHGTEFWAGNSLVWTGDSVEILNATSIGFWIYVPEDATQFSIYTSISKHNEEGVFAGRTGSSMEIYNEDYINNREHSGWMYFELPISDSAVYLEDNADCIGNYYNGAQFKLKANCFIEFYAVNIDSWVDSETNYAGDFTFYIDDVTINYSDAVDDREKPVFSGMTYAVEGMSDAAALNGQTVTENTVSFAGFVAEDMTNINNASGLDTSSAVAYIDGVSVDCEYADGMITISDAVLTNGVHTIRMGISDKMGNYSETKRQITVNTAETECSVRVQPQDSSLTYVLNDAVYWVDVEVDAIETVDSVEMKLDLDSMNNWELDQIKTLYGFDCEYSFATGNDKAENILTIKFTRNEEYLSETGTAVIASLPIRVWEFCSGDDHKHANAVEAWNCKYVCAPALSIDVDTEMGIVTYLDGTSHTFSSEDIHTLGVSYTYGLRMRDYDNDYYTSHSYHVHTAVAVDDLDATCTENGYTDRTWCETCDSPVDWGTTIAATGHSFAIADGVLKCACGQTYTGVWTDEKTYVDGVVMANGWVDDSYWQDGVKLTGVQQIDGYYYDFGEDGICEGQMKYTGLFYDETVSAWRYAKLGELLGGWVKIGDYWHYFNPTTKVAVTGDYYYSSRGITYHFDETGKTEGTWQKTAQGTRFWYGEWYYTARNQYQRCFVEIDGKTYNFDIDGYLTLGIHPLYDDWAFNMNDTMSVWEFDDEGILMHQITTPGTISAHDGMYLIEEDGYVHTRNARLEDYNGDIYFVNHSGRLVLNNTKEITVDNCNDLLNPGTYYFNEDGKLFGTGVREVEDGGLCYYENGKLGNRIYNSELTEIDGSIYLVKWSGKVAVNEFREITTVNSNGLISPGTYYFGEDGKLYSGTGVVWNESAQLYYYCENGKLGTRIYNNELVEINGAIYFVKWSGKVAVNETRTITSANSNGLLANGSYYFGEDGKLFTGVKEDTDGVLYYYKDGKLGNGIYNSKLAEINGKIYLVKWSGKVAANESRTITSANSNGLLANGSYYFGEDGKLFTGVKQDADGVLYYYENGQLGTRIYNSELVEVDGSIYFVKWSGKVAVNETRVITSANSNGLLANGSYYFGEDGKLVTE